MNNYYDNYVYVNKLSISKELCDDIILMFENETNGKYEGVTGGGLIKKVKKTIDFSIPMNIQNSSKETYFKWEKIKNFLDDELNRNSKIYINKLIKLLNIEKKEINSVYYIFSTKFITNNSFQIQKYIKNEGNFTYHDDFKVDWKQNKYRVITFLWYLNDVNEGGETELWDNYLIKPETGKLLLFPASWTFPHRGKMPISNDKYIITGWLYVNEI